MSGLLHIASLVVHHRIDATERLDVLLATLADTELALRDGGRSVLLCEGEDENRLLERIEMLNHVDGVVGVNLVHHHAECSDLMLEEIPDDHAP